LKHKKEKSRIFVNNSNTIKGERVGSYGLSRPQETKKRMHEKRISRGRKKLSRKGGLDT